MDELPLQRVLYFEPVARDVGTAYLQGVACAEGYGVSAEEVMEEYCDTYELEGESSVYSELPEHDLRRGMKGVEMGCRTGRWGRKSRRCSEEWGLDWAENESLIEGRVEKIVHGKEEVSKF
jgi:hypothetical protein